MQKCKNYFFYSVDKKASALPWFRWEKNLSRLNVIRLLNVLLTLQGCRKRGEGLGGLGDLSPSPPSPKFLPDQLTLSQPVLQHCVLNGVLRGHFLGIKM